MAKPVAERLAAKAHPIPFSGCLIWTGEVDKDERHHITLLFKPRLTLCAGHLAAGCCDGFQER